MIDWYVCMLCWVLKFGDNIWLRSGCGTISLRRHKIAVVKPALVTDLAVLRVIGKSESKPLKRLERHVTVDYAGCTNKFSYTQRSLRP